MLSKGDIETLKGIFMTKEEFHNYASGADKRFTSIDSRFEVIDERFEAVDKRFEAVDKRFDRLELEIAKLILDMGQVKDDVSDIKHTLNIILKKIDRPWQDQMLEDHEKRIHRLELGRIDN